MSSDTKVSMSFIRSAGRSGRSAKRGLQHNGLDSEPGLDHFFHGVADRFLRFGSCTRPSTTRSSPLSGPARRTGVHRCPVRLVMANRWSWPFCSAQGDFKSALPVSVLGFVSEHGCCDYRYFVARQLRIIRSGGAAASAARLACQFLAYLALQVIGDLAHDFPEILGFCFVVGFRILQNTSVISRSSSRRRSLEFSPASSTKLSSLRCELLIQMPQTQ